MTEEGWDLWYYEWDDATGTGLCVYERWVQVPGKQSTREEIEVRRPQPSRREHASWPRRI